MSEQPRIVFLDDAMYSLGDDVDFSGIATQGKYVRYANSTPQETLERSRSANILITNKAEVTAEAISNSPNLRLIAAAATGYDNVDIKAAAERDIPVCNVPGYAENTVPQHAFALILNLATQAYRYAADVAAGDWLEADGFTLLRYPTFELNDKTIGIVINSPGNPCGSILTEDDVKGITEIAVDHNLYVISDELYSSIIFDNEKHFY